MDNVITSFLLPLASVFYDFFAVIYHVGLLPVDVLAEHPNMFVTYLNPYSNLTHTFQVPDILVNVTNFLDNLGLLNNTVFQNVNVFGLFIIGFAVMFFLVCAAKFIGTLLPG